jgi:outer membrane immunogenic protein
MKKFFLATTAFVLLAAASAEAADMSVRPAYAPPPPVYSWTGMYWGANVGYSWGKSKYDATLTGVGTVSNSQNINGAIGGVQTGYNYQFGAWVWGLGNRFSGLRSEGRLDIHRGPASDVDHDR